ncbi:PLD nuclease N-terminal domain-containing protein [Halorubrum sp. AD140]|uniref:PLD nuclease N-terminal domain-containing protein n=1 Tax=Halorubrum sp. AD140 TaxID=3050073 RepID=UPI002ACD1C98|nr:PLD nuclease N-terminal domain-containing protein [Halorubrum sp. AD140]MDZ5811681.1 PLD nuclease N-terminal domain-containing protein [Halorubrum sp. AD140]
MSPLLLQGGGAGAIALLFGLLVLLAQLAIVVWIYLDAQKRSDQPAFLWAIVAFLAPLLGLVLYFIIGRNR